MVVRIEMDDRHPAVMDAAFASVFGVIKSHMESPHRSERTYRKPFVWGYPVVRWISYETPSGEIVIREVEQ